jgi:predicted GTPase
MKEKNLMNQSAPNLEARQSTLRQATLRLLEKQETLATQCDLPAPPDALGPLKQKIIDHTYTILVVGEAKRGKSTFINALIGKPILPTDVDIATSQVFRVRKASQESYRLRFENNDTHTIALDDLPRYGSQVMAHTEGVPRLDQLIRWIEVDVPATFLPDSIQLLDTPGLGSLYAQHNQITRKFIPQADAVIYVIDSSAPISQYDLDYLEEILSITPDIMFIQTHIDRFRTNDWQELQQRNEEILKKHFGERLKNHRVWPLSSLNLLKAAETGDDDYLDISLYQDLAYEIKVFLFSIAGWPQIASVITLARQHQTTGEQILQQRLETLNTDSKEQQDELLQRMRDQRNAFAQAWGVNGQQRMALHKQIADITQRGRQAMQSLLQPGGEVEHTLRQQINAIQSLQDAQAIANMLEGQVANRTNTFWMNVQKEIEWQWISAFQPFVNAAQVVIPTANTPGSTALVSQEQNYHIKTHNDFMTRLKGAYRESIPLIGLAGLVGTVGLWVGVLTGPVAGLLALGAAIFGILHHMDKPNRMQVGQAKQELGQHLTDVMHRTRKHFLHVNTDMGLDDSLVDVYIKNVLSHTEQCIQELTEKKLAESRQEEEHLKAAIQLEREERKQKIAQLQAQQNQWREQSKTLAKLHSEARALEHMQRQAI